MRAKAGGGAVILAGDIGGTRTRLALFERAGEALSPVWRTAVLNEGHASLAALLTSVGALAGVEVEAACFGVAGPVEDGVCRMTNLDWRIDEAEIGGMGPVRLVNDLSAIALGVAHLPDAGFAVLQEGTRRWGGAGMAVVAPGTGLGEAGLLWDGRRHLVIASEAGHADFAPAGELEIELYRFLRRRHGHVSYEHVASGPGLAMLAAFLTEARGTALPEALAALPRSQWPEALTARALAGGCPLSQAALDLFTAVLARETGNAALRFLALGGVCLAGGIAGAILPLLRRPAFLEAATGKGRMRDLLRGVPIRVALDPEVGLIGAARLALEALDPARQGRAER